MANYYGSARSNYFKVKDETAFNADMLCLEGIEVQKKDDHYVVLANDADGAGWNVLSEDPDSGEYDYIELWGVVAPHLADGEVAIFMEAGAEKLRYIHGISVAVNNKGETKIISLSDIYELAKELTDRPEDITEAMY